MVTSLAEFTIVPYIRIGEATPHPVLVLGVIWAIAGGLESGLTWGFVGGLALDVLGQRPLGSSAFSLLVAVGAASVIGGLFSRVRIAAPVVATAAASVIYSMLLLGTTTALSSVAPADLPVAGIVPSAVFDTVLAAVVGPLTIAIVVRRRESERVDW